MRCAGLHMQLIMCQWGMTYIHVFIYAEGDAMYSIAHLSKLGLKIATLGSQRLEILDSTVAGSRKTDQVSCEMNKSQ